MADNLIVFDYSEPNGDNFSFALYLWARQIISCSTGVGSIGANSATNTHTHTNQPKQPSNGVGTFTEQNMDAHNMNTHTHTHFGHCNMWLYTPPPLFGSQLSWFCGSNWIKLNSIIDTETTTNTIIECNLWLQVTTTTTTFDLVYGKAVADWSAIIKLLSSTMVTWHRWDKKEWKTSGQIMWRQLDKQ